MNELKIILLAKHHTGKPITAARLKAGRWQVYCNDRSFLGNPWVDLSALIKEAA